MTDLGSVGIATKIHTVALQALRSRLPKSIPFGSKFNVRLGRVSVRADEKILLVYLDENMVYGWERRQLECHTNYKPELLQETLDVMQKEMVLERLSDV